MGFASAAKRVKTPETLDGARRCAKVLEAARMAWTAIDTPFSVIMPG
jgi:hypothetical protein